jgi:hypothetical protein
MVVIGALAGAAVIGGGFALGSRLVGPSHPDPSPTASPRRVQPSGSGHVSTSTPPAGKPSIEITPRMGEPTTTFTVKGQNWPPRTRLTLQLLERPAVGSRPGKPDRIAVVYRVTSKHGAFSYRIKAQQFSLGTGLYGVIVTDPGSQMARAPFGVNLFPGG